MRTAFESAGDIRSVDLLSALVGLWRKKASGSLRFSRPDARAGFGLLGGELTESFSSQPQYDAAAILLRSGKMDAAALAKLQTPPGGDAALAALQANSITLRDWRWGQRIRAIEILSDLLGWLEGEYSFDAQARPAAGDWVLPVPRLVLELFLRSRDRALVEHYLGPSDLPLLRAEGFDEEFETFGLTSDAGPVVGLIDGQASAEEIAERAPADEFAVLKLLAALTTLGLVHPVEAASGPERGTGAPIGPEAEAPEAAREARREFETLAQEEAPGQTAREPPQEPRVELGDESEEPAPLEGKDEPRESPAGEGGPQGKPESAYEPVPEPPAAGPRVPADMMPERLEPSEAWDGRSGSLAREFSEPPADAPPPDVKRWSSGALLAVLLAVLVIAVAVLLTLRSLGTSPDQPVAASPQPTAHAENPAFPPAETAVPLPAHGRPATRPSPVVTRLAAMAPARPSTPTAAPRLAPPATPVATLAARRPPVLLPTHPPATIPPPRVLTGLEPTKPPTRVQLPAPPTAVAVVKGEATRAQWLARAERDREAFLKRGNVRYAVQVELACELPTLEKAWNWDKPAGTMWLLTTSYRGRTCFRVLWGRFGSLAPAREARTGVPGFFSAPGSRPTVVSVR